MSDGLHKEITDQVIGAAIEVHRTLGSGLLESVYEECLCHELTLRHLAFGRQVDLPITYKGIQIGCGYIMDLVVERVVLVELKAVIQVLLVHEAQLLTYMRLSGIQVGLLLNFHAATMKSGIMRRVL